MIGAGSTLVCQHSQKTRVWWNDGDGEGGDDSNDGG